MFYYVFSNELKVFFKYLVNIFCVHHSTIWNFVQSLFSYAPSHMKFFRAHDVLLWRPSCGVGQGRMARRGEVTEADQITFDTVPRSVHR